MTREEILENVSEVLGEYHFGSDGHRLYIRDEKLTFCSPDYNWYEMELKDESPETLLKAIIELIVNWHYGLGWYEI